MKYFIILAIAFSLFSCASKKLVIKEITTFDKVEYKNKEVQKVIPDIHLKELEKDNRVTIIEKEKVTIEMPKKSVIKFSARRKVYNKQTNRYIDTKDSIQVEIDNGHITTSYIESEAISADKTVIKSKEETIIKEIGFFQKIKYWIIGMVSIIFVAVIFYIRRIL